VHGLTYKGETQWSMKYVPCSHTLTPHYRDMTSHRCKMYVRPLIITTTILAISCAFGALQAAMRGRPAHPTLPPSRSATRYAVPLL
jgi:hypothetical protein